MDADPAPVNSRLDATLAGAGYVAGFLDLIIFASGLAPTRFTALEVNLALAATGGLAMALFLRLLLDPASRRAVDRANREMQAGRRGQRLFLGLFDREWGLFGSRFTDRKLVWLRAFLFIAFVIGLFLFGVPRLINSVFLVGLAFGVVTMTLLRQLKGTPASADATNCALKLKKPGSPPARG